MDNSINCIIIFLIASVIYILSVMNAINYKTITIEFFSKITVDNSSSETDEAYFAELNDEHAKITYILQFVSTKVSINRTLRKAKFLTEYVDFPQAQLGFTQKLCQPYQCYITRDKKNVTKYDVIAFIEHGQDILNVYRNRDNYYHNLPKERSQDQIYLFVSMEPSTSYPLCEELFDDYFNFTYTYKLDSDARCNYFEVLNEEGEIIGPNTDMNWIKTEDMRHVSDDLLEILNGKTKLVAWFVSNCVTNSKREEYVRKLELELDKYGLEIDIYGNCGKSKCVVNCDELLEKRYMFYLAFENAFDEDYVTEKVLRALDNSLVPVVYGGANYTRFLPDGSYLNARELGVERLAATLNYLMYHKDEYYKFFKWRNHYSFIRKQLYDVCEMCRLVTEMKSRKEKKVYRNFREWWHPGLCDNYT